MAIVFYRRMQMTEAHTHVHICTSPAIAEATLADISRLNSTLDNVWSGHKLRCAPPADHHIGRNTSTHALVAGGEVFIHVIHIVLCEKRMTAKEKKR